RFLALRWSGALAVAPSNGAGRLTRFTTPNTDDIPWSFSPDGKWLLFSRHDPQTGADLWIAEVKQTENSVELREFKILVQRAGEQAAPAVSPDGRWLAYQSDESGRREVYIIPFSPRGGASNGRWQVSNSGGSWPIWPQNSR